MLSRNILPELGPRAGTVESTARALRREIARHNLQVAAIALLTLAVAAGLWVVLYAVCCWLVLFFQSAVGTARVALPQGFALVFTVAAACSVGYAWVDRHFTPNDLPRDDKSPGEIAADFMLALPRITLAIPSTLSAAVRLTAPEVCQAAAFLHRLARERRLPLHSVPLDLANAAERFRILFALQLLRAIDLRRDERELTIRLHPSCPRALGLPRG